MSSLYFINTFCDSSIKMKPYGFLIHGAIDGFSQRIIWLELLRSNNNPRNIAILFLVKVNEMNGCPSQLVSDRGTENGIAATMQCKLREYGTENGTA